MAPAATIMPLTVTGLMMPPTPCEMAVTLEPDRDEPTWTGREVRSGEWACGGEGVGEGGLDSVHIYLDGVRGGPLAVDQQHVVRRELDLTVGVGDLEHARALLHGYSGGAVIPRGVGVREQGRKRDQWGCGGQGWRGGVPR